LRNSLNILIVDDDVGDRIQIRRALKQAEAVCFEAASVPEAFDACERTTFDCAMVDYRLAGHDGLAGIRMLHERFPYMALIMITGQGDELVATEAMKVGAMDYLSKSRVNAESVWRSVENAVEKASLQRTVNEQREELAKLADFMHSIISSSPFATIVTNLQGVITSVNPAAERMLWYRREDLINLETPLLLLSPSKWPIAPRHSVKNFIQSSSPASASLPLIPGVGGWRKPSGN
jgi:DNA-binding NtrC family response regulator